MKLLLIAIVCFWGWSHDPTRQFVSELLYKAADAVEPGTSKTNQQTIGERIDSFMGTDGVHYHFDFEHYLFD